MAQTKTMFRVVSHRHHRKQWHLHLLTFFASKKTFCHSPSSTVHILLFICTMFQSMNSLYFCLQEEYKAVVGLTWSPGEPLSCSTDTSTHPPSNLMVSWNPLSISLSIIHKHLNNPLVCLPDALRALACLSDGKSITYMISLSPLNHTKPN